MDEEKILWGARNAFFEEMLVGYATDGKNEEVPVGPDGYRVIRSLRDDGYLVVDRYCTTPLSDCSVGTTTIFHGVIPVWWMSYGGRYPKELIRFLKEAIRKTYEAKDFIGGRGPLIYTVNALCYRNASMGDFTNFRGFESIRTSGTEDILGFHEYWGMSLL